MSDKPVIEFRSLESYIKFCGDNFWPNPQAEKELEALRARIRTLEGLLGELEWSGRLAYEPTTHCCPMCDGDKPHGLMKGYGGHDPNCELKAALDGGAE